ncbi:MAG: arginase family protein [Bdellovibrionales bacterium]|nr:arginase family protein [Bdellovibrionales bacterium]
MDANLELLTQSSLLELASVRLGEQHVGEVATALSTDAPRGLEELLAGCVSRGARFGIIGVPEDIGARANGGRGGCEGAWESFLSTCCAMQANRFFDWSSVAFLGAIATSDLQRESEMLRYEDEAERIRLRRLTETLDERVRSVVQPVAEAGLIPVLIGGGHNNALPLIEAVCAGTAAGRIDVLNCDAHADFRPCEGRHSGNAFRYASAAGLLGRYFVFGLHEQYNAEPMLSALIEKDAGWRTFESIAVRGEISFDDALDEAIAFFAASPRSLGLEIDLDSIANMPTSAQSPHGFSLEQVSQFIHRAATELPVRYLHLTEAAPKHQEHGSRTTARALSFLLSTFLKATTHRK